ncbi:efflux RND transporter permease subunit [Opitutus terrae]|uniref:Acriflavin resistance protein n=1 Tax=Opitutus terrae (strain DSM 11246 / JCM 15787 / PB90-1) TaxID=452637 RepID=B1ZSN9_OPITP|nr:efflux RND transporter permease subunit [Opitutus terrae]ACB74738.1 acriflavin resistance protein [Opitutus terrae PB90-1]
MSASHGSPFPDPKRYGFAGRMASLFIDSKLTPIMVAASLLLGVFSILMLPREEEPQIKVPMIDILVGMPGASAAEVEVRVTHPMEKLLWEIPGVEYVYSTVSPGGNMTIVRFKVGTDLEAALVRLNQKLQTNFDRIPLGVTPPLVKPRTIDDVPILALTFHSDRYDHATLRRIAAQVDEEVKSISDVAETTLIGGDRRQVRVQLDPQRLASRNLSPGMLVPMLQQANFQALTGAQSAANAETLLQTGTFFRNAADVGAVVIGVYEGRPVYLRDVATIIDGPEEPANYVLYGAGAGAASDPVGTTLATPDRASTGGASDQPAVTLSVAKRPGANAVDVVSAVVAKVDALKGRVIPADVGVAVTRDYGATASEKSNELLLHMGLAVFGVAILILLFLGWRESLVVLLAIPVTLGLTLLVFYLYGYTLNRITLFALIFSIGILVDDAIVVVENIVRHMGLPSCRRKRLLQIAVEAVDEVGNPTILATWAVIAAVLPMAFVSGLMGPYMRPIPIGSSAAMLFSLLVAFAVTPWAALKILRGHATHGRHATDFVDAPRNEEEEATEDETVADNWFTRLYQRVMGPLLDHRGWRWAFLAIVAALTVGSMALVGIGGVKVKMLPFDNKSEFQVILNMPEGSTLEQTARVAREMAAAIRTEPEVRDYQVYAGTASPFNFNGLVRHYFMRRGSNVADLQVNLLPKHERDAQSHDIAKRVRPRLTAIAEKYGAVVVVAEVPPGPPVLSTLVAEIYGPTEEARLKLAAKVREIFRSTEGVVDVDWYVEDMQLKTILRVDKAKAALHGITEAAITRTVQMAVQGYPVTLLHSPSDREDVNVVLELPRALRARPDDLLSLPIRSEMNPQAPLLTLRELVTVERTTGERNIYHKNLKNVTYVTGDVAGVIESPVYAILQMNKALAQLDGREFGGTRDHVKIYNATMPFDDAEPAMKWDGEWQVTIEVFRDLGLAFGAVLILIYMLMVGWFKNYATPLIVMTVIPFSLIGILPAHAAMGAFFTATSMIGFMAGAGIVVRNSIILVDFIELRLSHGRSLRDACIESGAVRFRPMMLTAFAVVVGGLVILADPIFQGLAISLLFGAIASLVVSPLAVPLIYFMTHASAHAKPAAPAVATTNETCEVAP